MIYYRYYTMLIVFFIFESASVRGLHWMLSHSSDPICDVKSDLKVICTSMNVFLE